MMSLPSRAFLLGGLFLAALLVRAAPAAGEDAWTRALERGKRQQDREIASAKRTGKPLAGVVRIYRQKVINEGTPVHYYLLGRVYYLSNEFDEAIPAMRRALEIDPAFWAADWALAQILARAQRLEEAGTHLEALRRKNPRHMESEEFEARLRIQQGRFREAYELLRRVLGREPENWGARRLVARCLVQLEQWQIALPQLRKLVMQFPRDDVLRMALVQCLLEMKDWTAAVTQLRQVQRTVPKDPQVLWQLGLALFNIAKEQLAELQKALEGADPEAGPTPELERLRKAWLDKLVEAEKTLRTLDGVEPDKLPVLDLLQTVYAQQRKLEAQVDVLRRMRPLLKDKPDEAKRLDEMIGLLEKAIAGGPAPGDATGWKRNPMSDLLERCVHEDPEVRRNALLEYLEADIPFVDAVIYRRYDANVEPDPECRLLVVRILGKYRAGEADPQTVRTVARYVALALEDKEPSVRTVAAEELGRIGAKVGVLYLFPQFTALQLEPLPPAGEPRSTLEAEFNACRLALRALTAFVDIEIGASNWVPAEKMAANRARWKRWLDEPNGVAVRLKALAELAAITDIDPRWHLRYVLVDVIRAESPPSLALESYRVLRERVAAVAPEVAAKDKWWATFPRVPDAEVNRAGLPALREKMKAWWKSIR